MASILEARPRSDPDDRSRSKLRVAGLALALLGIAVAAVVLINGIVAGVLATRAGATDTVARAGAWGFGLTAIAFTTIKVGIALILIGILTRLWHRVESVKAALPHLKSAVTPGPALAAGDVATPYGRAEVSATKLRPLIVHRMARAMWAPMLAMGVTAVIAGFAVSLAQTTEVVTDPALATQLSAWVQGLQFLGEGFVLAGISFLLGTILYALRTGGGEVQESVGVAVTTLRMPRTGKLFIALMALGLMVEALQFAVYVYAGTLGNATTVAAYFAWLGPTREVGIGLLLSGIVLALATIARALGFQFWRLRQIVTTGR